MTLFKMQIACLCFIGYLIIYYLSNRHLNTRSSRIFKKLLVVCIINLFLDMLSIYTVNNLDIVPMAFNNLATKLFIISINVYIYLICCYILNLIEQNTMFSNGLEHLLIMPLLFTIAFIILAKPKYYISPENCYCYGAVANSCYIGILVYLFISLASLYHYWNELDFIYKKLILSVISIQFITSLIQGLDPSILITGLGVSLCTFCIFISLENRSRYIHESSNLFNELALTTILKEKLRNRDKFFVIAIVLENLTDIQEEYSHTIEGGIYSAIDKYVQLRFKESLFCYNDTVLTLVIKERESLDGIISDLEDRFSTNWRIYGQDIFIQATIRNISPSSPVYSVEDIMSLIVDLQKQIKDKMMCTDKLLAIQNRNAFERDINIVTTNRFKYNSICYIMIDVNNLKITNDQFGHDAGDRLLQDCVKILTDAISDKGTIYRLGGDEFGILIFNAKNGEIGNLLEHIEEVRQTFNANRMRPVSFGLGYSFFNATRDRSLNEMIKRADQMMYQNKFAIKHQQQMK